MSSLIGQNIGGNPRGILNLGATINTPLDTTLRNVTDGMGNNSPLQLSTGSVRVAYPAGTYNGIFSLTGGDSTGASNISFLDFIPSRNETSYYHAIGFAYDNSNWLGFYRGSRATPALAFGINLIWTPNYNLSVGHTAASARLHVRGDGTNPIARFESSGGTNGFIVSSDGRDLYPIQTNGQASITAGYAFGFKLDGSVMTLAANSYDSQSNVRVSLAPTYGGGFEIFPNIQTQTSGNIKILHSRGSFAAAAGSANYRPLQVEYTLNNTGAQTGTATGIFLRSTETNLNGMLHNFIDLGTIALGSLFSVANNGAIRVATIADSNAPISSLYFSSTANKLVWKDAGGVVNNLY
jgi:hypothetical protein